MNQIKNEDSMYIYRINEKNYIIEESQNHKICIGEDYKFFFDKDTGNFARCGKNQKDDPQFSPIGPEILDLEIASGNCQGNCPFCYKGNSSFQKTVNMNFDNFKFIIDKFPKTLTQIAFGICDIQGNPDFFRMMEYARSNGIIPNFTTNGIGLNNYLIEKIVSVCGAVAVSVYKHAKEEEYNAIKSLLDAGMKQTNIHIMISKETLPFVYEVINDIENDKRLENLNAVVFLGVKPKGRASNNFHSLDASDFACLCKSCMKKDIPFGFDSCSAPKFEKFIKQSKLNNDMKQRLLSVSESCESGLFSAYINVFGDYFPCSFSEGEKDWEKGISVLKCEDFLKDIWYNKKVVDWRNNLISSSCNGCRKCLVFEEINPDN